MSAPDCMPSQALSELMKWEAANGVVVTDEFDKINSAGEEALRKASPWKHDSRYFKKVFISAVALIRLASHAASGRGTHGILSQGGTQENWIEVLGMMAGSVVPNAFVIRDSFALPGVASETSVSITDEGVMHLLNWKMSARESGRPDTMCGWYHSHPGLGLFLSGADVKAQDLCQLAYEPSVALVIDPIRTLSTNTVHIKAFRTYFETDDCRKNHKPGAAAAGNDDDADVSRKYLKELGTHAHCFFELPLIVYKSKNDEEQLQKLWSQYWVQFLSTSPLTTTRDFIDERLKQLNRRLKAATRGGAQLVNRRNRGSREGQGEAAALLARAAERASAQMLMGALGIAVKSDCL